MSDENKNFILAMVLSLGILFLWYEFYFNPQIEETQRQTQQSQQQQQTQQPATGGSDTGSDAASPIPGAAPGGNGVAPSTTPALPGSIIRSRETVIAQTSRVAIDAPLITGSINLKGGRFDDVHLIGYTKTVNPDSGTVTLLNPDGAPDGFFAEQGWLPLTGSKVKVPNRDTQWQAEPGARLTPSSPLTMSWDNGEGLLFKKTIEIDDQYMFTITQEVVNNSAADLVLYPYALAKRQGTPDVSGLFILHEGLIGSFNGSVAGEENSTEEADYSDLTDSESQPQFRSTGGWTGFTDKYWAVALIPDQQHPFTSNFSGSKTGERDDYQTDYLSQTGVNVAAGATASFQSHMFAGAKVVDTINAYKEKLNIPQFELLIDWGWFYFITKPLYALLGWLQGYVGNYGIAILLATVIIKIAFLPLANKSYASMAKMKALQPQMEKLRDRYKDDRMKLQQEMMDLYKKEKVSPLSGCLPILVQIPVFFALYKVLFVTIDMRHAPFIAWIRDLSAPDPTSMFNLFGLIPWQPPGFLLIGVLPLIMGVTMWVQMKLNPPPPDPTQAMIFNWMPVFFTFLLGTFPAGLVLYWAWNNFLSILQQYAIMRRHGVEVDLLGNIKKSLALGKKPQKPAE